jgi:hypothetical protein
MADVNKIIKNTFFEFGISTDEPFAAASCGMRRVKSCPSICSKDGDENVFSEDGSACPRLRGSSTHCHASWADLTDTEEDTLSSCTSIDLKSWQSSDTPLHLAELTGSEGEKTPADRRGGQVSVSASPSARTPLSSKAGSFTPSGRGAAMFVPSFSCPQMVGIPESATERKQFTTLIIRNLPCPVTRDDLLDAMNEKGFEGLYNLVYLPIDFKTHLGMGYAFVNLISEEVTGRFIDAFNGFAQWRFRSMKVCTVEWALTQGLHANVERYRNSTLMGDEFPDSFKPVIFVGKKRVPFPEPTDIKVPKSWHKQ